MKFIPHLIIAAVVGTLYYFGAQSVRVENASRADETGISEFEAADLQETFEMGYDLYQDNCQVCHGDNGEGSDGFPNLQTFEGGEGEFRMALKNSFYPMPSFEGRLSNYDQENLWSFISEVQAADRVDQ